MPIRIDVKVSANAQRIVNNLSNLPRYISKQVIAAISGSFGRMKQELESPLTYSGRIIKPTSGQFLPKVRSYFASNINTGKVTAFFELKGGLIVPEQGKTWIEIPWKGAKGEVGDFTIHGARPVGGLGRGLQADAAMRYKRIGKRGVKPVTLLKKEIKIKENKIPLKVIKKWEQIAKKYDKVFSNAITRAVETATRLFEATIFRGR